MKKVKLSHQNYLAAIFSALMLMFISGCSDPVMEDPVSPDTANTEAFIPWYDVLEQTDLNGGIILVQNDESIQEAVDMAEPGSSIYIEPGVYKEGLIISKSDIQIFGLKNELGEPVLLENPGGSIISITGENIRIENIQLKGFDNKLPENSKLKSSKKRKNCIHLKNWTREDLGGGIAHYEFEVVMGEGEFDMVRIHRVVRENRKYRPVRTKGNVFMVHGAIQDFDDIFLTAGAEVINEKTSAPFYLAANNIDVWGIDLAWNMVPMETTDFSFMKGWGVEKDINHTLKAMSIARLIRGLTRQGFCRMNLLGFSYGVYVAYGAASRETQQHWFCRDVNGLIPVDASFKYGPEDEEFRQSECSQAVDIKAGLDAGMYYSDWGVGLIYMSNLAMTLPDEISPIPPFSDYSLTNMQALMAAGTDHSAGWHFFGGNFNEFFYSDSIRFVNLGIRLAPYMPLQTFYELNACGCNEEDVSFDDHLNEISLPILTIKAGASESNTSYAATLTASADVTHYVASKGVDPPEDFGHADLWMAYDADLMVWAVLEDWLIDHSKQRRRWGW